MAENSATDVRVQAQQALSHSSIRDLRNLQVERRNGDLVISGSVSRFYHKQLAQEIVLSICNRGVVNSVEVQ